MPTKIIITKQPPTILSSEIGENVLAYINDPDIPQYTDVVVRIKKELISLSDLDNRWDVEDDLVLVPFSPGTEILLTV